MTTKIVTTRPSFQGDLVLRRIDVLPAGAKPVAADGARHILAHSETGHHHVIEAGLADRFIDETNAFIGYLAVNANAAVEHNPSRTSGITLTGREVSCRTPPFQG